MRALRISLRRHRALVIRETGTGGKLSWTIFSCNFQSMTSIMWLCHLYLTLIFLSIQLAVAMAASDKLVTIILSRGELP